MAAALATTAAVSAMAPTLAAAQDAGATPAPSKDATPGAVDQQPPLTTKPKAFKRKAAKRTRVRATHRMVNGQSLWWLARKRLGPDASDAAVYRYLVKVWTANEQRIGTGDPNLVRSGTVLRLPPTGRGA